jgi:FAD-dependent oxidoreductase domain-containing protein 1
MGGGLSQGERGYDAAIVGGGAIGSSVAYFLKEMSPALAVCVIEPDPSYEFASTLRSSGGCRVQFTCPENIQMSLFGIDFIRSFERRMSLPDKPAHVDWVEGGYLFIVPPDHMRALEAAVRIQQAHGAVVNLLSASELKQRFPSINADDLGGGAHSPHDGWCDPHGLLWGLRRKAESLGVDYLQDRVVGADASTTAVRGLFLESGRRIGTGAVVNAAGAWSGEVARLFAMALPVSPLRRFEHYFTPGTPVERLPYVKDLERLAFRSEGVGFSGGLVDSDEPRGFNFDVDHGYFERVVWPAVAHRFPAFEAARCHRTWSGLYEQCELDGNAIIGPWSSRLANLYTAAGFSGHGTMHAPATGRAIAELIVHGEYRTIDLTRLGYERVEANAPYREAGIL